jgi:hypothetical protein
LIAALNYCYYTTVVVFVVALISFIVGSIINIGKSAPDVDPTSVARRKNFPSKIQPYVIVSGILLFIFVTSISTMVRYEVLSALDALPARPRTVVNGSVLPNPEPVLAALKRIAPQMAHHSHTERTINVEVQSGGNTLKLRLGRDSDRPQEYWVFYSGYPVTEKNEIGRITTEALDAY